jgi:peroxiredoxin
MKKLIVTTILATLVSFNTFAADKKTETPATTTQQSMKKAPDFTLTSQDGKTHSLKDFKGKIVVLEWFNNDCPFIVKHYVTQNMQKLQEKYIKEGVVWLSISSTKEGSALTTAQAKEIFSATKSHATALLLDTKGDTARAYEAKTTPHMFIIDKDGNIAYDGAIDDQPTPRKDSVKGAKNYVAENLDILLGKDPKKTKIEVSHNKAYGCSVKI